MRLEPFSFSHCLESIRSITYHCKIGFPTEQGADASRYNLVIVHDENSQN
jgi:hypothetical protein